MKRRLWKTLIVPEQQVGANGRLQPIVAAGLAALAFSAIEPTEALAWATKYSTPSATCGSATQVSTEIEICGGPTGAPYGLELQWMPAAAFTGIWPTFPTPTACRAWLPAKRPSGKFSLDPGECIAVRVGDSLLDQGVGVSAKCSLPLQCGTSYVFRVAARGNGTIDRSKFSSALTCGTSPCVQVQGCTYTQGFWKTHGPAATGGNSNEWPVNNLYLGNANYIDTLLQSILDNAPAGNGLVILAHQLIAAKLNVANGADATDVAAAVTAADALIGALVVPPVGSGSLKPGATSDLTEALADYNEGATGPGHCPE